MKLEKTLRFKPTSVVATGNHSYRVIFEQRESEIAFTFTVGEKSPVVSWERAFWEAMGGDFSSVTPLFKCIAQLHKARQSTTSHSHAPAQNRVSDQPAEILAEGSNSYRVSIESDGSLKHFRFSVSSAEPLEIQEPEDFRSVVSQSTDLANSLVNSVTELHRARQSEP